jgi:hypothetical protein
MRTSWSSMMISALDTPTLCWYFYYLLLRGPLQMSIGAFWWWWMIKKTFWMNSYIVNTICSKTYIMGLAHYLCGESCTTKEKASMVKTHAVSLLLLLCTEKVYSFVRITHHKREIPVSFTIGLWLISIESQTDFTYS